MLTLVKSLKTLGLSDGMDWSMVTKKVLGVTWIDGNTIGMSFRVDQHGKTRIYAVNNSRAVVFMTLYEPSSPPESVKQDVEQGLLDKILDASGINRPGAKRVTTITTFSNYFVFRMKQDQEQEQDLNIMLMEYKLKSMGIKTIMDFEVHGALVVKLCGITWHFFNTDNVLAIVGGKDLEASTKLVEESWEALHQ